MTRMTKTVLLVASLTLVGTGLVSGGFFAPDTVGERFRKALKEIEGACAKRKLEPNEVCGAVAKLKPADPLATEEGRFAHAIQIPNPLPADSGYRPGMTSQEYFAHLCKTEAGEFIYKTVDNVEGLFMMRPRESAKSDDLLQHLYAMEDPYGLAVGVGELPEEYFVQPAMGQYQYLEIALPQDRTSGADQPYRRYYRDENAHPGKKYQTAVAGKFVLVPYVVAQETATALRSRYGYTWRGVTRPHDRELGIAGGELIILDLHTHEVLAVRRGYVRSGRVRNLTGVWWLTAQKCSKESLKTDAQVINRVLKPAQELQERRHESK